ncbi:MAG: hypothetical protein AAF297_12705, partial [Planctomycetota bacterium]
AEGRFPPSRVGLVGDEISVLPVDGVTGEPYFYRVGDVPTAASVDGGCVLYAVGLDGVDNGGALPPEDAVGVDREPFRTQGAGLDFLIMGPDSAALGEGSSNP